MDDIGDGRYHLDQALVRRRAGGGLFRATDARLGRRVLVQWDAGVPFPVGGAAGMFSDDPVVARVLDGGDEQGPDGRTWAFLVYADSSWLPLIQLTRPQRKRVRTIVAPDTDELLVDPIWLAGGPSSAPGPVVWLPSPAEIGAPPVPEPSARWTSVGTFPAPFREEVA